MTSATSCCRSCDGSGPNASQSTNANRITELIRGDDRKSRKRADVETGMTRQRPLPTLLDIHGVAEHLGVTERHIRRLVAERRIPYLKWGHLLRFDPNEVSTWLDGSRREVER